MIKIFDANTKEFSSNGNIVISPLSMLETKKKSLNGWSIDVQVSVKYKDFIEQDKICLTKTKSKKNPQAFRIKSIQIISNKISFTANHICCDLENYFLFDVRPTNLTAIDTLKYINERTDNTSPFNIVYSDIDTIDTTYFIRKNLLEAYKTVEEKFCGVFDFDNYNVYFLKKVGSDSGLTIMPKKNKQGIRIYENWSNVCTRVYPVGKDGLLLDSKYVESSVKYDIPYTKSIFFQSELKSDAQTEENLKKELKEKAIKYLEENSKPQVSYEVTANIDDMLEIGDLIRVKDPLINLLTEVQEYTYNLLTKKIKSIIFGNYVRDVKSKFSSYKNSIENLTTEVNNQIDIVKKLNKTGNIYIDENEIFILNQLPKESAVNVWKFCINGVMFSSNGINGKFINFMDMTGSINADLIKKGNIDPKLISDINELIYGKIIWSNDKELEKTDININLENYKYYEILYYDSLENSNCYQTGKLKIGSNTELNKTIDNINYFRQIKITNNSIIIEDATSEDNIINNKLLVPIELRVFKEV